MARKEMKEQRFLAQILDGQPGCSQRPETQERSQFGWGGGKKMTPNSVLDHLSFRCFVDS